jgi:Flp pilus assembly protein TadG
VIYERRAWRGPHGAIQRHGGVRHRLGRRGTAVLETALALMALLPLAFGTIEFSYFFYVKATLQGAAREGARAAIVPDAMIGDVDSAADRAMAMAGFAGKPYTIQTQVNGVAVESLSSTVSGDTVTVVIQCPFGSFGVRPLGVIAADKSVQGACGMRKE